ncbi:hypothetical protein F52700_2477 [Fusarium sp. NRRL 52700]|nr:hypothetical protein F52700_2477 [Fusarium sp. NRRL 52700]
MAPVRPTNSGRGNSDRGGARRGRPYHGHEKAAPIIPAQNLQAFQAAGQRAADRRQAAAARQQETSVNDGDSNMTGVEESNPQPGPTRGGSRASRGGHQGRGGRGGHSGRGRVYHNNNQTWRQPNTSFSNMEGKCLSTATASEMIWVANSQGHKAAKIVNHTPTGGNSHAFAQQRPNNQRWGASPGYGMDLEAQDLMRRTGKSHVIWQMIAMDDEEFKAISEHAVEKTIEDHNGKNIHGKSALLLRHGVDPHPKQEAEEEEEKCKVCGNPDHTLRTCFSQTRQGETFGCPFCDTVDHSGMECDEIAKLSLTEQVKMLITDRGNMPAYHEGSKKQCWWKLLHKFCMSAEYDQELLTSLPWGKKHYTSLRKQGEDIKQLQKQHDANEGFIPPADPSTETFVRVAQRWDTANLPWPRDNLGERPPRPSQARDENMEDSAPAAEPQKNAGPAVPASDATDAVAQTAAGPTASPATTTVAVPNPFSASVDSRSIPLVDAPEEDDSIVPEGEDSEEEELIDYSD